MPVLLAHVLVGSRGARCQWVWLMCHWNFSVEQQYRFVYFNEMNLAVKSPLLSRRPPHVTISPDAMKLLIEVGKGKGVWGGFGCMRGGQELCINKPCHDFSFIAMLWSVVLPLVLDQHGIQQY